jgi:putative peptidoglycan binding protein
MSTVAPPLIKQLAADWKSKCGYTSATISGIIGDQAHADRGGYHIGRRFQSAQNYSCVRPDDKGGPSDAASAIDMTMNGADMRLCTQRLVTVFSNPNDPRRKYLNAFNGTTDSKNARRWDVYARKVKAATKDHLWHVHLEVRRKYVGSATAMQAILSALKGESVSTYTGRLSSGQGASVKMSSSVPAFPGVLKRNDKQGGPIAGVKAFQAQLIKRGVKGIAADGFFGPKLESAVKAWQARAGLAADGIVGPKTWASGWTGK